MSAISNCVSKIPNSGRLLMRRGSDALGRTFSTSSSNQLNLRVPFTQIVSHDALRINAVGGIVPNKTTHIPYKGLLVPGVGVNSLTGSATGASIVKHGKLHKIEGVEATTDGQTSRTDISVVESMQSLFESMSVAMSGGGSYGMFSGSASYSRSEVSDFNSQATTVLAATSVVNSLEYFIDGELKPEAIEIAKSSPESFLSRFGDSYVQGILRGGYFIAKVSVLSESKHVQKKIAASVSASFRGFGGGSGSFSKELEAYSRFSDIKISFMQRGGEREDHANLGSDLYTLSSKINKFATTVDENPVTLTAIASPYSSLTSFPDAAFTRIDRAAQKNRISEYAKMRGEYLTMRNDLKKVQLNPDLYVNPPSQEKLTEWQIKLTEEQNRVEAATRECTVDSSMCTAVSFSLPADLSMPKRVDSSVGAEESKKLGQVWVVQEGPWKGTWSRVGDSRIFEAVWFKESEKEEALLEVRISGDSVQIKRVNSRGIDYLGNPVVREGDCNYSGKLDGHKVQGFYACDWGSHHSWTGTIS